MRAVGLLVGFATFIVVQGCSSTDDFTGLDALPEPERATADDGTEPAVAQTIGLTYAKLVQSEGSQVYCPLGRTQCGYGCNDLYVANNNCGSCGNNCGVNTFCANDMFLKRPVCAPTCGAGATRCGGTCARLDLDEQNCGACGHACGANQECVGGTCTGRTCVPGSQQLCYTGPMEKLGKGICSAGIMTCNAQGTAFGPCVGQRLPTTERCDGYDNDCNGVIDDAPGCGLATTKKLTVQFNSDGMVYSYPPGIVCGTDIANCSADFPTGSNVQLYAESSNGVTYRWSGSCSGGGACNVNMNSARSVGISYALPPPPPSTPSCNGENTTKTFTLGTTTSYFFPVAPACKATQVVISQPSTCSGAIITSVRINGTQPAALSQQLVSGSTSYRYYDIPWQGGVSAPVTYVGVQAAYAITEVYPYVRERTSCTAQIRLQETAPYYTR